jgi:hypothetical protein
MESMTETEHTPGPWLAVYPRGYDFYVTVVDADDHELAKVPVDSGEQAKNLELIVAAPDLLAAVEAALLREDLGEELGSVLRSARDKAWGVTA